MLEFRLRVLAFPVVLVFTFEILLILIGLCLWRVISDTYLYGFTALCAVVLLIETVIDIQFEGAFGYFRAVQIVTCTGSAILLAKAAARPRRGKGAIFGSGLLLGYFAFIAAINFVPVHLAIPVLRVRRHDSTALTNITGPLMVVLLPIAPAAAVLSLARAVLTGMDAFRIDAADGWPPKQ